MLDVAETAHLAAAHAEVELAHVGVGGQLFGGTVDHHLAGFHDVAGVGHRQGDRGVLLDQQHGDALLGVDAGDDAENVLDQDGRQAQRGLVEQHQGRLRDQGATDGEHLLLAA